MSDTTAATPPVNDSLVADGGSILTFVGAQGGFRLLVGVDGGSNRLIVREARYEGAMDAVTVRVLDRLCTIIIGRPLQEAADHGAIYTAAALPEDCVPTSGIRTPSNAGTAFVLAERLIRLVHAAARQHFDLGHRENAWYVHPSADWLSKDEASRAEVLKPIIATFLRANKLSEDDIWICQIEKNTRVTIAFSEKVHYAVKPKLMMVLEQKLRRQTGNPLELFMEEMKDANRIRRL
jgi:hypothetical protein